MPESIRTIVVGVASLDEQDPGTGPGNTDPVLEPAIELASRLGATLHVVHAFELPEEVEALWPGDARDSAARRTTLVAEEVEARLEGQLAAFPGGEACHCHAREGAPARQLRALAQEVGADLVVVGASRRGRAWSGILGSTAGQVLVSSPVPVLVVHRPAGPFLRVLLTSDAGADAADVARRALAAVRALAGRDTPALRCLHVVETDTLVPATLAGERLEEAARRRVERLLGAPGLSDGAVEAQARVGDPGREIPAAAAEWGADLVVVAAHHDGAEPHRPLGRVAYAAVRGSPCNVLVIPAVGTGRRGWSPRPTWREDGGVAVL